MKNRYDIISNIENIAKRMRIRALKMALSAGANGAHLGGGLSLIEIMATLYGGIMNFDPKNPRWEDRDRLILSKGHGVLAYYTALEEAGFLTNEELENFEVNSGILPGHPIINPEKGIEMSAGSLGMGLSFGIGIGITGKNSNKKFLTYVILGDGECNEGTIWEAAASAAHFKLGNLVAIIDNNKLQYDGESCNIMNMGNMADKWRSFGWKAVEVNGHSVEELYDALKKSEITSNEPLVIVANTVKGKGVSFMENKKEWHHSRLTQQQYNDAIKELGGEAK